MLSVELNSDIPFAGGEVEVTLGHVLEAPGGEVIQGVQEENIVDTMAHIRRAGRVEDTRRAARNHLLKADLSHHNTKDRNHRVRSQEALR